MHWFVYVFTMNNWRYYVWSTNNIERRFYEHTSWKVTSTKRILPFKVECTKEYPTIREARQMEYRLKQQKDRTQIEKFIYGSH
jgi:predicted GIY-YIG superfamily endonuclease